MKNIFFGRLQQYKERFSSAATHTKEDVFPSRGLHPLSWIDLKKFETFVMRQDSRQETAMGKEGKEKKKQSSERYDSVTCRRRLRPLLEVSQKKSMGNSVVFACRIAFLRTTLTVCPLPLCDTIASMCTCSCRRHGNSPASVRLAHQVAGLLSACLRSTASQS